MFWKRSNLVIVGAGHDLAWALRSLVRAPGFTLTASLLLGLGVAATTTLFALVNAVILKPLPYGNPEPLVMVWESNVPQKRLREGPSPGNVDDWVAHTDANLELRTSNLGTSNVGTRTPEPRNF